MMYFFKLLLPVGQSAFYPFPPLNEKLSVVYYTAPLFTLLLALIIYFSWKKHKAIVLVLVSILLTCCLYYRFFLSEALLLPKGILMFPTLVFFISLVIY
jgi:hypothetical protein